MGTSELIAGLALIVSVLTLAAGLAALRFDLSQGREANAIAREALNLAKQQAERDEVAFIQPREYRPDGGGVVFSGICQQAIAEAEFEFADYAGFDRTAHRTMVTSGDLVIRRNDFERIGSSLTKPPGRHWHAKARWKATPDSEWEEGQTYDAQKGRTVFTVLRQKDAHEQEQH